MKKAIALFTVIIILSLLSACAAPSQISDPDKLLSREEAVSLALEEAGLTRDAVYDLDAELDREWGHAVWEVDFETRDHEYSYDINAETGIIEHSGQERD